ncbi:MAG TPA: DUF2585 family protein [Pyrinomonadaceae bacterium]|mgnify:CR=1 FL=1|nr:DUF2585 family protein [Pyrinomonadaceae bacterium]
MSEDISEHTDGIKPDGGLWLAVAATAVLTVGMAIVLSGQGRVWWCELGDSAIYINQAWNSSHTSQHLFDPYTFTHVLHGVLLFWLTGLILPRLAMHWRFLIAMAAEAGWEVLENSSFIIEKYRENTASLDYFGDSIANSVGDVIACAVGFWVAAKLGMWRSLAFFLVVEIALLLWIRDGLLLNILMLIYPVEWIKAWQTAM